MATTSFLRRELLPPPATFYRGEFPRLSRPSRGWARTTCPFHKGTNRTAFAVNLDNGGFFCHSCGVKGGDVITYVMTRDRLDFKQACRSLGCWEESETTWQDRQRLRRERERREAQRSAELERYELARRRRIDERDYLHSLESLYIRTERRLHQLGPEGPEADQCWELLPWLLDEIRTSDVEYRRLAGLEVLQ